MTAKLIWKNGTSFDKSADVFVIPKKYSVFIQTDKPVYKPGDEILYRILVLDSDLKPFNVKEGQLKHDIYDGFGNILPEPKSEGNADGSVSAPETEGPLIGKDDFDEETSPADPADDNFPDPLAPKEEKKNDLVEKKNGKITDGVYAYNYKLNDEPVEGDWSINVTINGEYEFSTVQPFVVKRYILPRFQAFIDTKHHVNKDEGEILLNIYANYTFGKFVSGKVKITGKSYDMMYPKIVHREVIKHVDVDIKSTVSFSMKDLNIVNSIRPYEIKFEAEFEENLTKQVGLASTTVKVYRYQEFSVNIVRERRRFKPGFPYKFHVEVLQANGHPAPSALESLKLSVEYHYKPVFCTALSEVDKLVTKFEYTEKRSLVDGKAQFTLNIHDNTTAFTINAIYFESKATANILRHDAGAKEYLTIEHVPKIEKGVLVL